MAHFAVEVCREEMAAKTYVITWDDPLQARKILLRLACLRPDALVGLHGDLERAGILYPCILYHNVDEGTRDRLRQRITAGHGYRPHVEGAVAWAEGTRAAVDLEIDDGSLLEAGMERIHRGVFRKPSGRLLYPTDSWSLIPATGEAGRQTLNLVVSADHEGACGGCGAALRTLFDFALTDARWAFLGVSGSRLRVAICEACTLIGTVCTKVTTDGGSTWYSGPSARAGRDGRKRVMPRMALPTP